uniref:Mariner Mos1 transposase n=1 Tax=Myotis lucifugus TaxID=59463 RepID=G1QFL4_MYOLU
SQDTCECWFKGFKSDDFDVKDKERPGQPKKFEDQQLQALFDEDACQTQKQLAQTISDGLQAMGKILKEGKWVPHQLNKRQMENQKVISKTLLQQHERKSFLHQIVTGNEKWIYSENPKCTKSWVDPGQPQHRPQRPNRFRKKTMLCVWWDQEGVVFYELPKPGETNNTECYRQQIINLNHALIVKQPECPRRHGKVILLHDDEPLHTSKPVKDMLKDLAWKILTHLPYSADLAPSDYHLFQHLKMYEEVENWVSEWFASKKEKFYWDGIQTLPERWGKCVASDGHYFE